MSLKKLVAYDFYQCYQLQNLPSQEKDFSVRKAFVSQFRATWIERMICQSLCNIRHIKFTWIFLDINFHFIQNCVKYAKFGSLPTPQLHAKKTWNSRKIMRRPFILIFQRNFILLFCKSSGRVFWRYFPKLHL